MECPDANELQALMSGQLAAARRAGLTEHLDGCEECRAVVASLARGAADDVGLAMTLAPAAALGIAATTDSGAASGVVEKRAEGLASGGRPGDKIGRYVVTERLGAGAMGVVYGARDPELGREVAIKVLKRPDPMLRDRLSREARAMAKVNHPNVVAVYDVGTVDEQVYVAMELVRGQTLRQWQTAKTRSIGELVEMYAAAGRGLAAAHAAGVVHRDFKPDNVLIGEDGRPRVTDFGLAGALAGERGGGAPARRAEPRDPTAVGLGAQDRDAPTLPLGKRGAKHLALEETALPALPAKHSLALEETALAETGTGSGSGSGTGTETGSGSETGTGTGTETGTETGSGSESGTGTGSGSESSTSTATATASSSDFAPLTQTGVLLGTPLYMAPEQFEGGNVDPRSDQWAFCVSLHEALFARRPFSGASWEELQQRVTSRTLDATGPSKVSPALRRIVHRGLSLRPGDRHATVDALIAELGRDRGTPWRRAAIACGLIAAIFAIGLAADGLLRRRAEEAAAQTFTSTGGQLERSVALRYESFVALADASYSVPVMHKVLGHKDQADFGFGEQGADTENLALVHDALISADWISWAQRSSRATIAVGDYKGRLLFTSADPARWGADLLVLSAASAAFESTVGAMVARYDDPRVSTAELYGAAVPAGLAVIFARALVVGGVPLGLFVQAIDGRQLLADVSLGDDVLLSLVAPDGSAVGRVPDALARLAAQRPSPAVVEVRAPEPEDQLYLMQARPLQALDGKGAIATLVLARAIDPGLSGLFASARTVFALAALLLTALALAAALRARSLALVRG